MEPEPIFAEVKTASVMNDASVCLFAGVNSSVPYQIYLDEVWERSVALFTR